MSTRAISVSTAGLVGREVDHAVRDDDVDRVGRQRDLLDHALEEDRVRDAGLRRVRAREREHLVGHVEPVREAGRADAPRREDHVDPAAGAEVEHRLALVQLGDRGRVAAAERREHGRVRQLAALLGVVERLAEVAASALAVAADARCRSRRRARSRRARTRRSGGGPPRADRRAVVVISSTSSGRSTRAASALIASALIEKYAHLPRCSRSSRPASASFLRWCETVACARPSGSTRSQTQTGSSLAASRLTIRTRAGSPSARNSVAVAPPRRRRCRRRERSAAPDRPQIDNHRFDPALRR